MRLMLKGLARLLITFLMLTFAHAQAAGREELLKQVADAERAFAATMASRDHAAFASFLSEEAVFFSGPQPLQGRTQVAEAWKAFFIQPDAPFSWSPEKVEVLASGTLALSSGPVLNAAGKRIATFTSIWRLEAPGTWRIVFDKGENLPPPCDCVAAKLGG